MTDLKKDDDSVLKAVAKKFDLDYEKVVEFLDCAAHLNLLSMVIKGEDGMADCRNVSFVSQNGMYLDILDEELVDTWNDEDCDCCCDECSKNEKAEIVKLGKN